MAGASGDLVLAEGDLAVAAAFALAFPLACAVPTAMVLALLLPAGLNVSALPFSSIFSWRLASCNAIFASFALALSVFFRGGPVFLQLQQPGLLLPLLQRGCHLRLHLCDRLRLNTCLRRRSWLITAW